jgi:hypothetical protein
MNPISHYLSLQWKLIQRQIIDFGLPLSITLVGAPILFFVLSTAIYYRTDYSGIILIALCFSWQLKISNSKRIEFLKLHYKLSSFLKIRMTENLLVFLPFSIVLAIHTNWLYLATAFMLTILLVFYKQRRLFHFSLPTPFHKKPFEFIIGIRTYYAFYPICSALLLIAYKVANPNLAFVALALTSLSSLLFYQLLEPTFWIWIHANNTKEFLSNKVKTAVVQHIILIAPLTIICVLLFPVHWYFGLAILLMSAVYLSLTVIAKYANYPNQISVIDGILVGISMFIPILLPFTFYYFLKKSRQQLASLL